MFMNKNISDYCYKCTYRYLANTFTFLMCACIPNSEIHLSVLGQYLAQKICTVVKNVKVVAVFRLKDK